MLRIKGTIFCCLIFAQTFAYGSGMALHIFMADKAVEMIKSEDLRQLLKKHRDYYRIGSVFPDSGYAINHAYGELSHWSTFLNQYQDNIFAECPDPSQSDRCEQVWSLFLGTLSHGYSDMNFDRHFVTESSKNDFKGDMGEAQKHTDPGCDFLSILDHKRLVTWPKAKLPYEILENTYKSLGVEVEKKEIEKGIRRMKLGIIAEPAGSPFTYLYYKFKMPWTAKNYYNARGGVEDTARKIAFTWDYIWANLKEQNPPKYYSEGGWPNVDFYVDDFRFDQIDGPRLASF